MSNLDSKLKNSLRLTPWWMLTKMSEWSGVDNMWSSDEPSLQSLAFKLDSQNTDEIVNTLATKTHLKIAQ